MSENIFGGIGIILILIITCLFGVCMNSTYLFLPDTIKQKISTDADNNYRTTSKQIEYIINEYYKDK
jgi:amino acid permease